MARLHALCKSLAKPFSFSKRFEIHIKKLSLFYPNQLLLDHQDAIAPEHNDPIHELLDDLGEVSTIESLIGELFQFIRASAPESGLSAYPQPFLLS